MRTRAATAGWVLLALGALLWGASRYAAAREHHSYAGGGAGPVAARVSAGHMYWLSVPGGARAVRRAHVDPASIACTATAPDGSATALKPTAIGSDVKEGIDQFASFVAPQTSTISVSCAGLGTVYVDDADDATPDRSGLLLLLAVAALLVGPALLLSAAHQAASSTRSSASSASSASASTTSKSSVPTEATSARSSASQADGGAPS